MGTLKELVEAYMESGGQDKVEEVVLYIQGEGKRLLEVVEILAGPLTQQETGIRLKGTSLLTSVIHGYPCKTMTSSQVEHFVLFYIDRLRDHHSVQPIVIYGVLGLISYQHVPDVLVVKLLAVILFEVHIASLSQADRRNVYNIFTNLLETKMEALKTMGSDFVLGFIQAMDGESDPRNLLICFANCRLVLDALDYRVFAEDFFEVLSCYFPVDFSPPKNAEFAITREDLARGLHLCLSSRKDFAEFAVPLFIEKLSSDVQNAKIDTLVTFAESLNVYDVSAVEMFLTDIWLCVRKDLLFSDGNELFDYYLEFAGRLAKCLSVKNEALRTFVQLLTKDCVQTIRDPDMTIAQNCGELIRVACSVSLGSYEQLLEGVLPTLKSSFNTYVSATQRRNLIELTYKIYSVRIESSATPALLVEFTDYLLELLYSFLSEYQSLIEASLKCLTEVLYHKNWFPSTKWDLFATHIIKPALVDRELDSCVVKCYETLLPLLVERCPDLFETHCLPKLTTQMSKRNSPAVFKNCVSVLGCSTRNSFLRAIMSSLSEIREIDSVNVVHLELLCDTLARMLERRNDTVDKESCIVPLMKILFSVDPSLTVQNKLSLCFSQAYRLLEAPQQIEIVDVLCRSITLCNNSTLELYIGFVPNTDDVHYALLTKSVLMQVTSSQLDIACGANITDVLEKLWQRLFLTNQSERAVEWWGISFVSVLNKSKDSSAFVEKHLPLVKDHLVTSPQSCVSALTWLCKACVLSWDACTCECLNVLLECLQYEGSTAAQAFHVLVTDCNIPHSVTKLLCMQRFIQYMLPKLIENYSRCEGASQANHVTAISHTLQGTPLKLMQKYLKSLIPILLLTLDTSVTSHLCISSLSTIGVLLDDTHCSGEQSYVNSLVHRLLELTKHQQMEVRILSVKNLIKISRLQTHMIYPLKSDVIKGLRTRLDDRKRLVRMHTMKCINHWYLVAS